MKLIDLLNLASISYIPTNRCQQTDAIYRHFDIKKKTLNDIQMTTNNVNLFAAECLTGILKFSKIFSKNSQFSKMKFTFLSKSNNSGIG